MDHTRAQSLINEQNRNIRLGFGLMYAAVGGLATAVVSPVASLAAAGVYAAYLALDYACFSRENTRYLERDSKPVSDGHMLHASVQAFKKKAGLGDDVVVNSRYSHDLGFSGCAYIKKVFFNRDFERDMTQGELEGMVAHEIAHVESKDYLKKPFLIFPIVYGASWAVSAGANLWSNVNVSSAGQMVASLATVFGLAALSSAIQRTVETRTDLRSAQLTERPEDSAAALEKEASRLNNLDCVSVFDFARNVFCGNVAEDNEFKPDSIDLLFSSHPPLSQRAALLRSLSGGPPGL